MTSTSPKGTGRRRVQRFCRDARGASAVEFSIVCAPFFLIVLYMFQLAIYYFAQSALDVGVSRSADAMRNNFNNATAPTLLDAAALKSSVAANAGGLIANDATLAVEIRQLASLSGAVTPITDGVADYGSKTSVLVLRAQSKVIAIAPGMSSLTKVASTSILRRQGR